MAGGGPVGRRCDIAGCVRRRTTIRVGTWRTSSHQYSGQRQTRPDVSAQNIHHSRREAILFRYATIGWRFRITEARAAAFSLRVLQQGISSKYGHLAICRWLFCLYSAGFSSLMFQAVPYEDRDITLRAFCCFCFSDKKFGSFCESIYLYSILCNVRRLSDAHIL